MKSKALASLISSLLLAACAVTADPIPAPTTSTTPTTPPAGGGGEEEKPDAPPAPLPPPDPTKGECKAETTQTACFECCDAKHEDGAGVFYLALFDCICADANCKEACGDTMCNDADPKEPDAACNACMAKKNADCQLPVAQECQADPDCVAYDKCVGTSGCASKKAQ